ncbi:MAG: T9SS type A sorting domain-containing protein [Bacteroidia bacterium]
MKKLLIILISLFVTDGYTQVCTQTTYGNPMYIPINDLGAGVWNGFVGGLYPNGSNFIPSSHQSAGLQLAQQIQPLDANGIPDMNNGKIGFISIGMSNTTLEFSSFISLGMTDPLKNPKVKFADCAEGGMSVGNISNPSEISYSHYWDTTVVNRLNNANLSAQQVQVIWYKEADIVGNSLPPPQVYSDSLISGSKRIMNIIKVKFPNAKICYIASRIYAGYATSNLNPEPYSYWQGWAMKWMIEDQINNDPLLQFSGANANAPWLCWGTYNWANGINPRSDGLTWDCPTDFNIDGTHPSTAGRLKVATKILNFLGNDSLACWYRLGGCSAITSVNESDINLIHLYPNPTSNIINFSSSANEVSVFNIYGHKVLRKTNVDKISTLELVDGIYLIQINKDFHKIIVKH